MKRTVAIFIAFIVSAINCRHATSPEPFKDPRDYVWTIDTISFPDSYQTMMNTVWGSNSHDIYVAGWNDKGSGKMFHFDGARWTVVEPSLGIGAINDMVGFKAQDIWAVGDHLDYNPSPPPDILDSGLVIRYDGSKWRKVNITSEHGLYCLWASSPDDIWMGGMDAALFHYDGVIIRRDSLPVAIPAKRIDNPFAIASITGNSRNNAYVMLYAPLENGFSQNYLFKRQSGGWALVDSSFGSHAQIWMSPSGKLFRFGWGVFIGGPGNWKQVLDNSFTAGCMFGTEDDNLFLVGYSSSAAQPLKGEVFHYDGTTWKHLDGPSVPGVAFGSGWTDNREVFIVGQATRSFPQTTIVLHGR